MTDKHHMSFLLRSAAAAILLLTLAGCATLETIPDFSDPRIGFLVAGATGNDAARQRHAATLADIELARRKQPLGNTVPELAAYERVLMKPLQVNMQVEGSTDLAAMPKTQTKRLGNYFRTNPDRLMIDGRTASREWAGELKNVQTALAGLRRRHTLILGKAEAMVRKKDQRQAAALYEQALQLDRSDEQTSRKIEENVRIWLSGTLQQLRLSLGKGPLAGVAERQKTAFGTDKIDLAGVAECRALALSASEPTQAIRKYLPTNETFVASIQSDLAALKKVEGELGALHARCHTEQLKLLCAERRYWAAHEYSAEALAGMETEALDLADPQRKALFTAYARMMPDAVTYYVGLANDRYAEDAYGLALIFCRMSQEISAFGRALGIPPSSELKTWQSRTEETARDCRKLLTERMSRRIIVPAFSPTLVDANALAATVYNSCVRICSAEPGSGKAVVWGVRAERKTEQFEPMDYLVEVSVPHFSITELPTEETAREIITVGLGVRQVPNPMRETDKDAPPLIYQQDVLMYQKTGLKHTKEVRINVGATLKHQGELSRLLDLSVRLPDPELTIPGITVTGVEQRLDPPFVGPSRTGAFAADLRRDPLPNASAAQLSSDLQIRTAMLSHAGDLVVEKVTGIVSAYPIRVLVRDALRHQEKGDAVQAANAYGYCLEYCGRLGGADEAADPKLPPDWPVLRQRMQDRIKAMGDGIWCDESAAARRILADIWKVSTESAVKTIERQDKKK